MSRCHQTDAILDATFAGTDLTRTQAAHAAVCGECARALSQSRRFESDLNHVGLDVSPEPMPPAAEVAFLEDPYPKGGAWMTLRRVFAGGAIAVVVVGAVLIGVKWLPGNVTPIGVGSEPPAAALAGEFDGWLRDAGEAVADSTGEGLLGGAPHVLRAEQCGREFTAVLEEDGSRDFYWVSGPKDDASVAVGGDSYSLTIEEIARKRARLTDQGACEVIIEATISRADAGAAVEQMGGIPDDARVKATSLLDPSTAMVVMEGSIDFWAEEQWWVGLLHRSEAGWSGVSSQWIGTNTPAASGGLKLIRQGMIAPGWPATDVLVAELPLVAGAIELDLDGVPHRYETADGEDTLILALPGGLEERVPVRFIPADGQSFGGTSFGEQFIEP